MTIPENSELKRILQRIQKMLKLSKDSGATEGEAATAAAMAMNLMRKYNIDHADLAVGEMQTDPSTIVMMPMDEDSQYRVAVPLWVQYINNTLSRLLGTVVTTGRSPNDHRTIWIYGHESDAVVHKWLVDYLIIQIDKIAAEHWKPELAHRKHYHGVVHASYRRKWKDEFRVGVVIGLINRLEEVYAKEPTAAEEPSAPGEQAADPKLKRIGSNKSGLSANDIMVLKQDLIMRKYGIVKRDRAKDRQIEISDTMIRGLGEADRVSITRVVTTEERGVAEALAQQYSDESLLLE